MGKIVQRPGALQPANVECHAAHTLSVDGIHIGLSGRAHYRGTTLLPETATEVLQNMIRDYRDSGRRLLDKLEGSFALTILDLAAETALIAVDRLGIERITYSFCDETLVFGNSANAVAGFPSVDRDLRHQAIYDFLFMHMVPAPETIYERKRSN